MEHPTFSARYDLQQYSGRTQAVALIFMGLIAIDGRWLRRDKNKAMLPHFPPMHPANLD